MKLTKKVEAEILSVYQDYWDSYLSGDLKNMGGLLSDDFILIGTSDGEVFNNKKSAMKYLKATIDQVAGVLSKKNIEVKITQLDDTILVSEFFDAYIKLDGKPSFYDKFRASTVMKRVRGKWKIIHQHGSLPDSKAEIGETLASEKVKKENRELREAVKRRTLELEQKNRDLEIEASLEKVRARAMAMKSSAELADLIGMIYAELTRLDVTLDRCFIMLFDEPTGDATWWMASGENASLKRGYHLPFHKNSPHLAYLKGWRNQDATWKYVLKGDVKKKWDDFIFSKTELAQLPKREIANMKAVKLAHASAAFNKYGCITTGTLEPLTSTSFSLLKRFSRVFEQTYTRFLDLKNAEAQARESQIQLALERVRARTMAMQHSDELQEASNLLFKQLQSLEIPIWSCGYNIWGKHEKICTGWMSTLDVLQPPFRIPLTESPTFIRFYKSRKKNEDFYVEKVEGKALVAHYKYMFSLPDFARIGEEHLKAGNTLPESQFNHVANFAHGNLVFITNEPVPDAWDIFKRFAKVFEQTYTRFLDLKKVEAQAREAQIEIALEKIRSRSLAMHNSKELSDVIGVVFSQLNELKVLHGTVGIQLFDFNTKDSTFWPGNTLQSPAPKVMIPYDEKIMNRDDCLRDIWHSMSTGKAIFNKVYTKKQKDQYFKYVFAHNSLDVIFEESRKIILQCESLTLCFIPEKNSALYADSFDGSVYTEEEFMVLKRTAKVFEQAYIRFLDLQKAEAQAREAQIEAALERIRARTMAMQRSDELNDLAILLFQQVSQLGIKVWTTGFNAWSDDNNSYIDYITSPQGGLIEAFSIDVTEYPVFVEIANARKSGVEFWVLYLDGEMLKGTHAHLRKSGNKKYEKMAEEGYKFPSHQYNHFVFGSKVSVMFITYEPVPESHDIFIRFGKVFEQTYTRFLDLKKAEAQAREAQIEAALEKVRARTMGMQRSDELSEAAKLMFQQIKSFGLQLWGCGFNIWEKEEEECITWMSSPDGNLVPPAKLSLTEQPVFVRFSESRKNGVDFYTLERSGKELGEFYDYLKNLPDLGEGLRDFLKSGGKVPTFQVEHVVNISHGNLIFITYQPCPDSHDIFKRFGKVFEQTYTRFLDLKKAEAQAREAQIEASLERVRSRTMAMHKSDELLDVITVVSEQLQHVGIKFGTVSFGKNSPSFDMDFWVAAPDLKQPIKMFAPYSNIPIYNRLKEAYREKKNYFSDTFTAEETKVWNQHIIDHNPELFSEKSRGYLTSRPGMTRTTVLLKNVFLFLINYDFVTYSDEDIEIVIRFANVFEQTYTRFLDLQKAEEQAREAQIDAALERLRSRTMAMQRSTELAEVSQLLHQQFLSLGVQTITCAFMFPDEEKNIQSGWTVLPDGTLVPQLLNFPLLGDATLDERYTSWKEKRSLHRKTLGIEENRRHHQFLSEQVSRHISKHIFTQLPDQLTFTNANFAQGYLMTFTTSPLAAEEENILVRFAKVFEQTYTRFLDLQKAEAQARDAQIESALEKIRSRSLAMHHSGELKDVVAIMFEKMKELNVVIGTIAIQLFDQNTMGSTFWAGNNLHDEPPKVKLPYDEKVMNRDGYMKDCWESKKKGENIINKEYTFEQKTMFFDYVFASNDFATISEADRDGMRQFVISPANGHIVCLINEKNSSVFADSWNGEFYSEESVKVLIRAAKVFEQAYVRFLDLQKAEAQARESQIEAALERVRARTMAMHKSEELLEVIVVVSQQLTHLDFRFDVVSFARNSEMHDYRFWFCLERAQRAYEIQVPYLNNPMFERIKSVMARGEKFFADTLTVAENREWIEHMLAHDAWPGLTDEVKNFLLTRGYARSIVFMPQIMLLLGNYFLKPYSEEQNNILKRFAAVFEQSYTRFLDLQKAEAQAREAQIEAALERVRSKAMAMHTAEQLSEVVHELRIQMGLLGQKDLNTCVIHLNDESPEFIMAWAAIRPPDRNDEIREFNIRVPKQGLTIIEEALKGYGGNQQDYVLLMEGEKLIQWMEFLKNALPEAFALAQESPYDYTVQSFWSFADFQGGSMLMVTHDEPDETTRALLRRFTNVFGLAYRRFADLKQAEAQAREATIEAALEKIRSRSLGMHNSEEILDVVAILFGKLKELGLVFDGGAAIHLFSEGSRDATIWVTDSEKRKPITVQLPYDEDAFADNPVILDVWRARETGESIINKFYAYEQKNKYFQYVFKHNHQSPSEDVRKFILAAGSYTATFISEKNSLLGANSWTEQKFSADDIEVLKRVARVFEQAYVRFLDLQKAEVHAKEVVCLASLDRVRAEIASMRTVEDLDRITPLIWRELNTIGIPFIRCGVFIMDELNRVVQTFLSTPDGKAIAVFQLPFDVRGRLGRIVPHWQDKKIFLDYWDEEAMKDVADTLVAEGIFSSPHQYLDTLPKEGFHLHLLPFAQGMLYVGNLAQLKDEELSLLQSLADAFATAYARYDDFNKLEVAKQQVDRTLVDLKQAQQQLVQSEKMASLGELTAGIAHEIQNPLNFVNNFSEVSNELIDEMKTELTAGNVQAANELADSIKQNLEKITHHGKRADGIVKGMLQHSRAGSGQKEPTDLNFLCDEYLRLAYHGYRAKEKSFNAKFESHFDSTLPKINVVAQDIGRVVLNLINNAFYAVSAKASAKADSDYEPTVSVITKNLSGRVEIRVTDNGIGISEKVKEKIFQPFFTTKPTGQGTGLGLSLSYDIIKAHGGTLEVNSPPAGRLGKDGVGSEFIIQLPTEAKGTT